MKKNTVSYSGPSASFSLIILQLVEEEAIIAEREAKITKQEAELDANEAAIAAREKNIADQEASIAARKETIPEQQDTLAQQQAVLAQKDAAITALQAAHSRVLLKERSLDAQREELVREKCNVRSLLQRLDPKRKDMLVLFLHPQKNLMVVMQRQRAYTAHRRRELEAAGFLSGNATALPANTALTWSDFQKALQQSGSLVRHTVPNVLKRGANINSMQVTQDFDVQGALDTLKCQPHEAQWLWDFLHFAKPHREERTMDD